uniref:Uncharacterized protein n=1 Tax=Arundo donax TaxID=35708 RepID=A0A0A9FQM3_ARUDO
MLRAPEATPLMGAGSSLLKGRRAPVVLSSVRPAVATAASTAGCRSTRLHGITCPTHHRRSREVLQAWSLAMATRSQSPSTSPTRGCPVYF